jgi:pyrimidine-specific ribonucleoside hydrolase
MQDRRRFILRGMVAMAGLATFGRSAVRSAIQRPSSGIPLVHITDLYHPPQDPDDHIDLATIAALPEFDLRGVVLDVTQKFLDPAPAGWDVARDPGYISVVQLGHITGKAIPVAAGPVAPLNDPSDDLRDRPASEQAGVRLLLDILEDSPVPVTLSLVGSARVAAAAFNREPGLLRRKISAVLLNAGSTAGTKREWNVGLDSAAYMGLWRSGLPIHWYPCATAKSAFDPADERGTFWKTTHATLFGSLTPSVRAWFTYALTSGKRNDIIRLLSENVEAELWGKVLQENRNMWATASLVMAAGRVLARTPAGWRFVPANEAAGAEGWPWRLDPITATIDDQAIVGWSPATSGVHQFLFGRKGGTGYGTAMGEALGALLSTIG